MVFKSPCSASAAAQGHTSGQPKAPLGFEPRISCLLDRRFNQLSHGANLQAQSPEGDSEDQSSRDEANSQALHSPKRVVLTTE